MPCRIGITTKPEESRAYWQHRVAGFANWEIVNSFKSERAAKEYETQFALRDGCEAALGGGGAPPSADEARTDYNWWYVYHFSYGSTPD